MYMSRSTQLQAPVQPKVRNYSQPYIDILNFDRWRDGSYDGTRYNDVHDYARALLNGTHRARLSGNGLDQIRMDAATQLFANESADAAINKTKAEKYQRDLAEYNSWKESTAYVAAARDRELASRNASNPGAPTSRASLLGMGTNMLTEAQRQASVLGAHNMLEEQKRQKTLLSKGW